MAAEQVKDKSRVDLELNLSFIDRTEAKIQSPDREVLSPTGSKDSPLEKVSESGGRDNKCTEDINGNTPPKTVDTVTMATKSTGNASANPTGTNQEICTSKTSGDDERESESFIDRKESRISVDTDNLVKPFHDIPVGDISDVDIGLGLAESVEQNSIPLNTLGLRFAVNLERMNNLQTESESSITRPDSCMASDQIEIKNTSETLHDEDISGKDKHRTYEIMSATSNLLFFEKVHKEKNSDDSPSDELDTEQVIKTRYEQSESSQTNIDAPLSPSFSKDSQQNVTIEEDEENVIIHLDTEFSQENMEAEKVETSATAVRPAQKMKNSESNTEKLEAKSLPSLNLIEVERKFKVTADSKIRLLEIGAELRTEKQFHDTYFDSSNYSLILSDCWLRQRNSLWELKVTSGNSLLSLETRYMEITNEREIISYLVSHFHSNTALLNKTMVEVMEEIGLEPFAEFSTTRQTYFLPECTIDLDLSDFGFQVGEIEVMVTDDNRIAAALNTIDTVAEKLGFEPLELVQTF